jgi:predicted dehydrogenase
LHAEHAVAALLANCHVLCEKPMATTVPDCTRMIDIATSTDRVLAVGMVRRFFPAFRRLKQLIDDDALGPIQYFEYREGKRFDWEVASAAGFQRHSKGGGGVLFDIGPHAIDLLLWLFGVPEVLCAEDDALRGVESNVKLQLRTPALTGMLQLSWDTPLTGLLRIQGAKAEAALVLDRFDKLAVRAGNEYREIESSWSFPADALATPKRSCSPALYPDSIHCQLVQFVRAIRWREAPAVDGFAGRDCISVIESAMRMRQPLEMDWLDPCRQQQYRQLRWSCA